MFGLYNLNMGKNGTYIVLRIVMLIGFSLAIYITTSSRQIIDFASVEDLAVPAIVGVIGIAVIGVLSMIKSLRLYTTLAVLPADWVLVGAYVYYILEKNLNPTATFLLLLGIASVILVSGTMRLGPVLGGVQNAGVVLIVGVLIVMNVGFQSFRNDVLLYIPGPLFLTIMAVTTGVWFTNLDEENASSRIQVRKEIEESRLRLDNMRERASAVADMASRLNMSLNYEHILDAALDIGRLSIRNDPKERVVSMALMVTNDEEMEISTARGLAHTDLHHTFRGVEGIIGQGMEEGKTVIIDGGSNDPELKKLKSFANIQTTMCIPLRANYETYGVLIFGSTGINAINEDHIDTLQAIGVQATVALKNAVLYDNLREEKERIIRIEEEGRKSLVRDLHDIPTQTVSAVAMHLSTLPMLVERNPEKFKEEVDNIREMAMRAAEEIRHVLFTIRPLSLETQGLSAALNQLADKMQQTYKQPMQIRIDTRIEKVLSQDAQGTLFYLIEEASNNARKYAEASMVQVRGTIEEGDVVIRVRDNGKGFDTGLVTNDYASRGSFGMVNMTERAELIDGHFDIQSSPGKGTQVIVRVPIDAAVAIPPSHEPTRPLPMQPRQSLKKQKKTKQYSGPLSPST